MDSVPTRQTASSPYPRWTPVCIALHWGSALTASISLGAMLVRQISHDHALQQAMLILHQYAGLCVLGLFGVTMLALPRAKQARLDAVDWADWTDWAAQGLNTVLYSLMFLLPLLGWALVSARGQRIVLLGDLALPNITGGRDTDLADMLYALHAAAAWIFLMLVVVHAWIALWHHFVRRDNALRAMLPVRVWPLPRKNNRTRVGDAGSEDE